MRQLHRFKDSYDTSLNTFLIIFSLLGIDRYVASGQYLSDIVYFFQ